MSIKSISSLAEFLKWHEEQKQLLERYNKFVCGNTPISFDCFFRGMSSRSYELVPSIYRRASLLQNEDKIVADCLAQRPQDFRDDKSTFERLVRMQHYGIPTRLLDVTRSPLVALYFAAQSGEKKHKVGKLTSVFVSQQNIKYADSDTVSEVANIANMPYKAWSSSTWIDSYQEYIHAPGDIAKQKYLPDYNKLPSMRKLHQQILREKPYFQPRLEKDDLERVWCVIPPMNNERIQRQQGAFLLFGVAGQKKHCIEIINKDLAELLLKSIDILEKSISLNSPIVSLDKAEEKKVEILGCVYCFDKYFRWAHIATSSFSNALNSLSPTNYNFGTYICGAKSRYFQQIVDSSASNFKLIETKRTEDIDANATDLENLTRYKFFYDIVSGHRAVFQNSVEVRNKSGILQELNDLGITKSYLFPDLSSVGEEINARYPVN